MVDCQLSVFVLGSKFHPSVGQRLGSICAKFGPSLPLEFELEFFAGLARNIDEEAFQCQGYPTFYIETPSATRTEEPIQFI